MYLLFFNTEEFCHFKEISPLLNSAFVMLNTQKKAVQNLSRQPFLIFNLKFISTL